MIEDSSKTKFGGGQKVTLNMIEALQDIFQIYLLDCKKKSLFQKMANKFNITTYYNLTCFGKIKLGHKQSFSIGFLEVIIWPFALIYNLYKLKIFINKQALNSHDTIIYAPHKKSLILSFMIYKLFKFKYIFHAHSLDKKDSFFYSLIDLPQKNATKIICVSNSVQRHLNFPNCITIYNPIKLTTHTTTSPKTINNKKIVVAVFATLIPLKGIKYFIESYNFNNLNMEYRVYGYGDMYHELKAHKDTNIKIMGFCTDTLKEMQEVDIVVVPSIAEESFGMVIIEAFSLGIPVITTNIGGQSEIVINHKVGLHVPIKDSKSINESIKYLVNNTNIYKTYSLNALEYSKTFSYEIFQKKIINLFQDKI